LTSSPYFHTRPLILLSKGILLVRIYLFQVTEIR